jgi:hypothetical protein
VERLTAFRLSHAVEDTLSFSPNLSRVSQAAANRSPAVVRSFGESSTASRWRRRPAFFSFPPVAKFPLPIVSKINLPLLITCRNLTISHSVSGVVNYCYGLRFQPVDATHSLIVQHIHIFRVYGLVEIQQELLQAW